MGEGRGPHQKISQKNPFFLVRAAALCSFDPEKKKLFEKGLYLKIFLEKKKSLASLKVKEKKSFLLSFLNLKKRLVSFQKIFEQVFFS